MEDRSSRNIRYMCVQDSDCSVCDLSPLLLFLSPLLLFLSPLVIRQETADGELSKEIFLRHIRDDIPFGLCAYACISESIPTRK